MSKISPLVQTQAHLQVARSALRLRERCTPPDALERRVRLAAGDHIWAVFSCGVVPGQRPAASAPGAHGLAGAWDTSVPKAKRAERKARVGRVRAGACARVSVYCRGRACDADVETRRIAYHAGAPAAIAARRAAGTAAAAQRGAVLAQREWLGERPTGTLAIVRRNKGPHIVCSGECQWKHASRPHQSGTERRTGQRRAARSSSGIWGVRHVD